MLTEPLRATRPDRVQAASESDFGESHGNKMNQIELAMILNDDALTCTVSVQQTLHDLLRDLGRAEMTAEACADGSCCRCTVRLNEVSVCACHVLAVEAADQHVQTIQHFGSHPLVQQVRAIEGPCGRCLGAHAFAALDLLRESPRPSLPRLRQRLVAIPCQCHLENYVLRAVSHGLAQAGEPHV